MGGQGNILSNWASQRVTEMFPALGKLEWDYCWTGKIAYSEDHLPHCQQLQNGLFSVAGYSGRGIGAGYCYWRRVGSMVNRAARKLVNSNNLIKGHTF
ncbi:FAD-dependent oxidoreductase [Marinomonas sp. GJ51-6]|uniref:FAD-dependent oxidoreductase n=1 Tax=Marinomonas sp. GJ51-6 TaxID=2992802 RepID=UPI003977A2E6